LQLEAAILRYLAGHPAAKDTVEGIAEWWLPESRVTASVAEVRSALDGLVARGQMAAEQNADGRIYYRRPQAAAKNERGRSGTRRHQFRQQDAGRPSGRKSNQQK
jgi:hypothetical protein